MKQTLFHITVAQPADCLMHYTPFYRYTYKPFTLMHLLLVSLITNNVIIDIGIRLLIECILILKNVKVKVNCHVLYVNI